MTPVVVPSKVIGISIRDGVGGDGAPCVSIFVRRDGDIVEELGFTAEQAEGMARLLFESAENVRAHGEPS